MALVPDLVIYLKADISTLISRMVYGRGFNYWESGMDMHLADNLFDGFRIYQEKLIWQFDQMAVEYGFVTVDANRSVQEVFEDIRRLIRPLIARGI